MSDILRNDIAAFIMYLSASDSRISQEEVQAYRVITGYGGDDINSIIRYIKENHIYSMDFESEPPLIMQLVSEAEHTCVAAGIKFKASALKMIAALYGIIGEIIISIDGGISYTERRDLNIIMSTIDGYADDHDVANDGWSNY